MHPVGLTPFQASSVFIWSLEPDTNTIRKLRIKIIANSLGVLQTFKDKHNREIARWRHFTTTTRIPQFVVSCAN